MQLMVEGGEFPRIKSFSPVPAQHTAWSGAGVDAEEKPPTIASKERSYTIILRKGFLARRTFFRTGPWTRRRGDGISSRPPALSVFSYLAPRGFLVWGVYFVSSHPLTASCVCASHSLQGWSTMVLPRPGARWHTFHLFREHCLLCKKRNSIKNTKEQITNK